MPSRLLSSRRKRTPNEWNVLSHTRSVRSRPISGTMRSAISRAALLVKVTPRIASGRVPRSISRAMRAVITRVLPEPAPARTSMGPWSCSTASRCAGLRLMAGVWGARTGMSIDDRPQPRSLPSAAQLSLEFPLGSDAYMASAMP